MGFSKTRGKFYAVLLDKMAKAKYKQEENAWAIFFFCFYFGKFQAYEKIDRMSP